MKKYGSALLVVLLLTVQGWAEPAQTIHLNKYEFDRPSEIKFKANAFLHDFTGVTENISGRFELNLNHLEQPGRGAIELPAKTLNTKNTKRDKLMREKHLQTESYPLIRFVIIEAKLEYNDVLQKKADYVLLGEFQLHGQSRIIRVIATLDYRNPERLEIVGSFPVKMTDYNIPIPSVAAVFRVKDKVNVTFSLTAVPKS